MSLLAQLENAIAARLRDDPDLAGIPILVENQGDLSAECDKRDASGLVYALVSIPGLSDTTKPKQSVCRVAVTVRENILTNRGPNGTGKTARDIAEFILSRLGGWAPGNGWGPFREHTLQLIDTDLPRTMIWQVAASTHTQLQFETDLKQED